MALGGRVNLWGVTAADAVALVRLHGEVLRREAPKPEWRHSCPLLGSEEAVYVPDIRREGGDLSVALLQQRLVKHLRTLVDVGEEAVVTVRPLHVKLKPDFLFTRAAVDALRNQLERQLEEIEGTGSLYQTGGLIFVTESGSLINPSNLRNRSFKPLNKRAGSPDICFHDLRHTCATLLLSQGTHPKLVQELLGRATISMTLHTYTYFLPSMGDQTVRAMEAALS